MHLEITSSSSTPDIQDEVWQLLRTLCPESFSRSNLPKGESWGHLRHQEEHLPSHQILTSRILCIHINFD